MDALEPSEAMLDVASAKNIYTKCIYGYLNMTNVKCGQCGGYLAECVKTSDMGAAYIVI